LLACITRASSKKKSRKKEGQTRNLGDRDAALLRSRIGLSSGTEGGSGNAREILTKDRHYASSLESANLLKVKSPKIREREKHRGVRCNGHCRSGVTSRKKSRRENKITKLKGRTLD